MGETVFIKTTCTNCGVHVEFPIEAEGETVPCPKCGGPVSLIRELRKSPPRREFTAMKNVMGSKPSSSSIEQKEQEWRTAKIAHQKSNLERPKMTTEDASLTITSQFVSGAIAGMIAGAGGGLLCLLAIKLGWAGLDKLVAWQYYNFRGGGCWGLLVIPIFICCLVLLGIKKHQSFKRAFAEEAHLSGCISTALVSLAMTFQFFYSPPPDKHVIDCSVNWALINLCHIEQTTTGMNVFDYYRLVNQYTEKVGSEKHYVYDFEANCTLVVYRAADGSGQKFYTHSPGNRLNEPVTINGSVTLVKKGNDWYSSKTVWVH
jgi:hypothetical protein